MLPSAIQAPLQTGLKVEENVPLGPRTTLGIGGPARFFASIASADQLLEAVEFARIRSLRLFTLGSGSNLLVQDSGFDGLVLHIRLEAPVHRSGDLLEAAAGTDWDDFVRSLCEQEISGVECLAGIPGLVGGSPIQNIGAYGQEVAQTIHTVTALDLHSLRFVTLPAAACAFGYRRSLFNTTAQKRYIVTSVAFRCHPGARPNLTYVDLARHFADRPAPTPIEVYHAVRGIRQAKGMLLTPGDPDSRSAGSFFKNPIVPAALFAQLVRDVACEEGAIPHWPGGKGSVKLSAAWLVERAGFSRGYRMGAAGISSRHTLALINRGGASFAEIAALRDRIVQKVQGQFNITLEQEPVELGA